MIAPHGFVRVMRSADLAAREGLESQVCEVQVGHETVLMGRLNDGRVVAFGAACPHEMTDLRDATFVDGLVRCPRHNYMYDPHSGANVIPTKVARRENLWKLHPGYLPTYSVEERDGWVCVGAAPQPPTDGWDPALEEPPAAGARPEPPSPPPTSDQAHAPPATVEVPPKRLRVRLGREFALRLPLGVAPAHTWRIEAPVGLLAVVEQRIDATSPARLFVRIAARALGKGTLRCSFGRPWDAEPEEVRTYIVEVVLV